MSRLTYYKATRPGGTDFRTGTINYAGFLASGEMLTHPETSKKDEPSTYFSVSIEPAETLIGGSWPCRLFRVEPVGRTLTHSEYKYKRCCHALRVVEELPAGLALGPNSEAVLRLIDRAGRIDYQTAQELYAAGSAAWDAARDAAWYAARYAARSAAWSAAGALVVRDLLAPEHFDILTKPWRDVIGPTWDEV